MCFCFNQGGGISAQLDVVISSGPLVDSGTDTTLTCTSTKSGSLRLAQWSKGSFDGTYNDAAPIVYYLIGDPVLWGNSVDPNHYEFDQTINGVPLTIKSVTLDDEAKYWCTLNIVENEQGSAVMRVRGECSVRVISHYSSGWISQRVKGTRCLGSVELVFEQRL